MHVIGEVLPGPNLCEHASCQNRGRDSERLIVLTAGEWAAVVAKYVVGGQLPTLDYDRCIRLGNARRRGPLVAATRKLPDRLAYKSFDVGAVNIPHDDQQHSRRYELCAMIFTQ